MSLNLCLIKSGMAASLTLLILKQRNLLSAGSDGFQPSSLTGSFEVLIAASVASWLNILQMGNAVEKSV